MTEVVVGPTAVDDLLKIREDCGGAESVLSQRFASAIDVLLARLEQFPRSAPVVVGYTDVRRAVVHGFPFVVFYRYQPGRIDVLRVLHAARSDAGRPAL